MEREISLMEPGFSVTELLVGAAVLAILVGASWSTGSQALARQRLESASRRLAMGIEHARAQAQQQSQPCGLSLTSTGWSGGVGALPGCLDDRSLLRLDEGVAGGAAIELAHNLPPQLRFSSNGLVLDGGMVVLSTRGTTLRRCLVMALPLGIVRLGRYEADPASRLDSSACEPDPAL